MRVVSVKDVAEHAGVSVGTVSNVLNHPEIVRAETLERVRGSIAELGFVPNGAARQLREGRSRTLALIVLDVANPFFTDVAHGVEVRAAEAGYTVLLANAAESSEREAAHLSSFEQHRVAGVLISPVAEDLEGVSRLRDKGIEVVLVDHADAANAFPSVSVDDVAGGTLAAEHLLGLGRKKLAFVGGPTRLRQVADRLDGADNAVQAVDGASMRTFLTNEMTLDEGRRVGRELRELVRASAIDGIIAANDLVAIGIERSMLFGPGAVSVPGDVAIVGYDDIDYAASAVVPLTSVRQPRELIGATAVELLLAAIDGGDGAPRQVVFAPSLVVRESTVA